MTAEPLSRDSAVFLLVDYGTGAQSRRDQRGRSARVVADRALDFGLHRQLPNPWAGPSVRPATVGVRIGGGGGEIALGGPEHRIAVGFVGSQLDMTGRLSAGLIDAPCRCVGERA
jgi:hypothetical protein